MNVLAKSSHPPKKRDFKAQTKLCSHAQRTQGECPSYHVMLYMLLLAATIGHNEVTLPPAPTSAPSPAPPSPAPPSPAPPSPAPLPAGTLVYADADAVAARSAACLDGT